MHPELMQILQQVRDDYAKPIFISSGFRSIKHPVEQMKDKPGEHTKGMAVDIICHGYNAIVLLHLFVKHGIQRFGFHQKGNVNGRFMHVGVADKHSPRFIKTMWTY